ncbi:uncharacterized protein LOC133563667 isoform X2 [Nerophis ophidion]|uniref:uncharacterized protein LOC133563667 isoform X2 n=1 Tax=Nerophis ophidion TaxID=159077 RepID=UPI002AE098EC|nr:uncharacterized protein LOC133563667 isoform X2 [Nerophis ophidion]
MALAAVLAELATSGRQQLEVLPVMADQVGGAQPGPTAINPSSSPSRLLPLEERQVIRQTLSDVSSTHLSLISKPVLPHPASLKVRRPRPPTTGLRRNPFEQLEDLDLDDDLALISGTHAHIQHKTTSKQIAFKRNTGKTKVMRLNTKSYQPITIEEHHLEDVVDFVYLGSTDGGADKDVELRISRARHAFGTFQKHQKQNVLHKCKICPSLWL